MVNVPGSPVVWFPGRSSGERCVVGTFRDMPSLGLSLLNGMFFLLYLENMVYHKFRQLLLVLGVKLMEINSNFFSRYIILHHSFLLYLSVPNSL